MVEVKTRLFGTIQMEDDKLIHFDRGILGFPQLRTFTLIYDVDKGKDAAIKWLQSVEEPGFAMPVMNPDLVMADYCPKFDRELLTPLGSELGSENTLLLVTVTVPKDVTATTVNLRAPIIINTDTNKAVQLINDDEQYSIKYAIYDTLMAARAAQ